MIVTPGPALERIPFVLSVAYGVAKSPAVCAAIRGGLVHGLVTHASLARALLRLADQCGGDPSPRGSARRLAAKTGRCPAAPPTAAWSIRVGDTVLRPTAPCWRATHALLAHLSAAGFDGAPRVLAVGPSTETLTYIDGQAAVPPLPEDTLTDAALVSVADLLRRYHRAAASFDPAGYSWPRPIPARFRTGLVSHNDVHPANLVFRDGRAVGADRLRPGRARQRRLGLRRGRALLGAAAGRPRTSPTAGKAACWSGSGSSCYASGLPRADRRHVAEAVVANHDWTYAIVTEAAAAGHQGFADHWRTVAEPAARARRWCQRHQRDLLAAAR